MLLNIKYKALDPKAVTPQYSKYGDAGADLYSVDYGILEPKERRLINTGIALEIPFGWAGFIHPRSGLANSYGITVVNSPGTVDSGYRGPIMINLLNTGIAPYTFCVGDRIAQIIFQQVDTAYFEQVEELSETVRGSGGHGSTGGFDVGRV